MIYYADLQIVLQEVPGQISLCVSVTGCPLRCKGCHSPFLWKKGTGTPLTDEVFITTLERYKDMISCVLFMGGEWEETALIHKLQNCPCLWAAYLPLYRTYRREGTYSYQTGTYLA